MHQEIHHNMAILELVHSQASYLKVVQRWALDGPGSLNTWAS